MRAINDVNSHFIEHCGNTASSGTGYFLTGLFATMEKAD